MGCCDSKERKDKDSKVYDESFDEGSTKYEQEDFKINFLKKTVLRKEQDRQAHQNNIELNKSNTIKSSQINPDNNIFLNNSTYNIANLLINNEQQDSIQKSKTQLGVDNENEDQEERKSVANTEYYTPPHNPSEIPLSYQEDSFMLDIQLNAQPKAYMEIDPHSRRTLIKQNFEEQSDQLLRTGSVPIYLKNSKAFIITNGGQNFDLKQFLEETKTALEVLQNTQSNLTGNINKNVSQQNKESSSSISDSSSDQEQNEQVNDSSFESVKNVFDDDFDKEVNQPFGYSNNKQEIKYFYQLDDIQNRLVIDAYYKKLKPQERWDYLNIEDELLPKEQKVFKQLKEYFVDFIDYPNKKEISDHYLLRFLKARKFDLNHTKKFLEAHLNWRQNENIDNIFNFQQIIKDTKLQQCLEIKKYYPNGLHYTDKQGRPIYIERLGKLNLNKLFEVTSQEGLVKYYIQFYEKMIKYVFQQCTLAKGQQIDKMIVIIDCKDISLRVDQITSFLKTAVNITKENYPEILHKMYIINTGMMVNIAWKGISVLLGEKTKKKIVMLGSKYIHELEEDIPRESIPKYLGGKCTCRTENCINENNGPIH